MICGARRRAPPGPSSTTSGGTGASKHVQVQCAPEHGGASRRSRGPSAPHWSLDRIAVLGDSYGGMIAMAYAAGPPRTRRAAHPLRFRRALVEELGASASPGLSGPRGTRRCRRQATGQRSGGRCPSRFGQSYAHDVLFHRLAGSYLAHMGDLGFVPAVRRRRAEGHENLDLTPKLPGFKFPALVITGRYDMNVAPAHRMAHGPRHTGGANRLFREERSSSRVRRADKYLGVLESFLKR